MSDSSQEADPLMSVKNLSYSVRDKQILNDISLDLRSGTTQVILGPSGAGKSSLLKAITFLNRGANGTLVFDGRTIDMETYTAAALVYWVVCSVLYYALEHLNNKIQYAH